MAWKRATGASGTETIVWEGGGTPTPPAASPVAEMQQPTNDEIQRDDLRRDLADAAELERRAREDYAGATTESEKSVALERLIGAKTIATNVRERLGPAARPSRPSVDDDRRAAEQGRLIGAKALADDLARQGVIDNTNARAAVPGK